MKIASTCLLIGVIASAAVAQLTPGVVVRAGVPTPIVADFNGDGLADLVQERNVLLSNGAAFSDPIDLGLPQGESVVGVLDVNGDGILDLLTGVRGVTFYLRIGSPSHTYDNAIFISTGTQPYIADADGDGLDDLLLFTPVRPDGVRTVATDMVVLRSRGDGTFERREPLRIPADPVVDFYSSQSRVMESDMNHDGIPDLVLRCANDLVILRGTGGGRFAVETRFLPMAYGGWSTRLADIDGDGNDDVVLAADRGARVFFGDGHGNFPRTMTATIPQLHGMVGLPAGVPEPGNALNPKNIALGHFTRADRVQIAAGTIEGDLGVISYEQGALKVVSQIATEFWLPMVQAGDFHGDGVSDIYAMETLIGGDIFPRPRLFNGSKSTAAPAPSAPARTRRHAAGPGDSAPAFRVQMHGDCIADVSARFVFARSGFFAVAHGGDATIEAIFDPDSGGQIFFRLSAPFAKEAATGVLTGWGGAYSATPDVLTDCGWRHISITASAE